MNFKRARESQDVALSEERTLAGDELPQLRLRDTELRSCRIRDGFLFCDILQRVGVDVVVQYRFAATVPLDHVLHFVAEDKPEVVDDGCRRGEVRAGPAEDRGMRIIHRLFPLWVTLGLVIPAGIGWLVGGDLKSALTAFFWAGLVRMFLVHHVTFSINSICHFFGRRRFETEDMSTNVFWLAVPSFGESWHHNHHAFPRSAMDGLRWREVDLGGLVIRAMKRLGLAWNVVMITPERQQQRATQPRSALRSGA